METYILEGVGNKIKSMYAKGEISEKAIEIMYRKNKAEADEFSVYGFKECELAQILNKSHNPLLKDKLKATIEEMKNRSRKTQEQNRINLEKLDSFLVNAAGIGLRPLIKKLHKTAIKKNDFSIQLIGYLLETEFANLSAKRNTKKKQLIYERKELLLNRIPSLISKLGWKYGFNYATGKNACYLVYVYLPNGTQLTWHTNSYDTISKYPLIFDEWDGQSCMTLTKLVDFVSNNLQDIVLEASSIAQFIAA